MPSFTETHGWHGHIRITVIWRNEVTGRHECEVFDFDNLITDAGRDLIVQGLKGDITDSHIKYVAVGDSTTAPAVGQTKLGSEKLRKAVTKQELVVGTHGRVKTTTILAPYDATTFTINEIGWFAGANASAATDSGVMVARVLWTRAKTNLESVQIDRTDAFV